jgi:ribosomal protein S18 acetylase RimI-like enzyme
MSPTIRPFAPDDLQPVVNLSLRAWAPVFASVEQALAGSGVFEQLHPDWHDTQRWAVLDVCADDAMTVWVAEPDEVVVGFAAVTLHDGEPLGQIYMIAVDPDRQRRGVGLALTTHATDWIRRQGMTVALVGTGGDPGHAPARRLYERAGYIPLPGVKYFKRL